ncbi:MAG: sigma-70 family RNA polymerase sigma factor, partial [Verrucomicrobiae bacterium]|nr:sigma-70 family RNA polymerase sigma factor [Verrucomicrobiae bacterium]
QAVFLVLARKAGSIGPRVVLSGWLFRTTRFVAVRAQRAERRRTHHETLAAMQPPAHETASLPEHWQAVEPHLDAALAALPTADRDAVLLRYFEGRPLRTVGEQLGVNEEAAKKRVSRAVEKLRAWLTGRGILLTTTGLLTLLGNLPTHAAPAGLAGRIASAATANSASAATAALAQGAVRDGWLALIRQVLPWAAAALLLLSTGVWGWLLRVESAAPVAVATASSATVEPPVTTPAVSAATDSLPAQPGPSKILLSVRSAKDNRPLIAQVVAALGGDRGYLETLEYQTDADGTLEVPVNNPEIRSVELFISASGHVPVRVLWKHHEFVEPILLYNCLLEQGEVLAGVVQDEAGQPVPEAQIQFIAPGLDWADRQSISYHPRFSGVTTDAQGRFRSDQVPLLRGNRSGMSYAVLHPDFVRARIPLWGPESLATNHVVVLERGSWVTGRVVGPGDLPVPGAELAEVDPYAGPVRKALSEADGSFSLGPFATGTMQIEVASEGFQSVKERVSVVTGTNDVTVQLAPADGSTTEWQQIMDAAPTVRV